MGTRAFDSAWLECTFHVTTTWLKTCLKTRLESAVLRCFLPVGGPIVRVERMFGPTAKRGADSIDFTRAAQLRGCRASLQAGITNPSGARSNNTGHLTTYPQLTHRRGRPSDALCGIIFTRVISARVAQLHEIKDEKRASTERLFLCFMWITPPLLGRIFPRSTDIKIITRSLDRRDCYHLAEVCPLPER